MVNLLTPDEIKQMRQHLEDNPPLVGPPEGREYWDVFRITATLETFLNALVRIANYQTSEKLRQNSENDYGLDYKDALEMAYENMQEDAKAALSQKSA